MPTTTDKIFFGHALGLNGRLIVIVVVLLPEEEEGQELKGTSKFEFAVVDFNANSLHSLYNRKKRS